MGLPTARIAGCGQGSRPRAVPVSPDSQAHTPPVRLSVGTSDGWNDARAGPPLGCVYTRQYTVCVVKRQQERQQKLLINQVNYPILLFPYGRAEQNNDADRAPRPARTRQAGLERPGTGAAGPGLARGGGENGRGGAGLPPAPARGTGGPGGGGGPRF